MACPTEQILPALGFSSCWVLGGDVLGGHWWLQELFPLQQEPSRAELLEYLSLKVRIWGEGWACPRGKGWMDEHGGAETFP